MFGVNYFAVFINDFFKIFPYRAFQVLVPQQGRRVVSGHCQAVLPVYPVSPELGDFGIRIDQPLECCCSQ